jgi:NAD(P)H-dependent FMN reductase
MSKSTVLALVGSLRADSHNRKLAEAIQLNAPEGVEIVIHESLGNIPFYNEDIDVEARSRPQPPPCARQPARLMPCCWSPLSTTAPCPPR